MRAGSAETLLSARDVHVRFGGGRMFRGLFGRPVVRAVDGVSIDIGRSEVLGLVGESGSGKTTLGRALLRLTAIHAGSISFDGADLADLPRETLRRRAQIILQDPHASLSPRLRVRQLLTEPYRIHRIPEHERYPVEDLLHMVQLASEQAEKYPHQLSGGQARRVGIARVLALKPDFVVADEPTAGLDVSAVAGVLELMRDLRRELGVAFLLITHDVNVVGHLADRIAVMYLGQLVEVGDVASVMDNPAHPYTHALLAAVPTLDPDSGSWLTSGTLSGEIPSPVNPPPGCRFHPRCRWAGPRSSVEVPRLESVSDQHSVACHYWREIQSQLDDYGETTTEGAHREDR